MAIHEECGVFGILSRKRERLGKLVYYGLYALQHRGQESCGIVVNDDGVFSSYKDLGLVSEVFSEDTLAHLSEGNMAVGHVRYGTTGRNNRKNCQPIEVNHQKGKMALAHNGNLSNALELRDKLELSGAIFHTTSDTETIAYMITRERLTAPSIEEAVSRAMTSLEGAYSLILMSSAKMIAVRDPYGFRPLCYGKMPDGSYVIALESCALTSVGAELIRDLLPGEILVFSEEGVESRREHCGTQKQKTCIFEYIYFARPDSHIDGVSVYGSRIKAGKFLAMDSPVEADLVTGVPESGNAAALGYSLQSGIPYGTAFVKNGYVGRTFIKPKQSSRESSVRIKLNVLKEAVAGKRVVMIDDSIVRGTTSDRIVRMLREAGATEVHVRISSPPFLWPCYFGTDIPEREQLIAYNRSIEDIRKIIGADSLGYLGMERLDEMVEGLSICRGCFNGKYPMEPPKEDIRGEYFDKEIDMAKKLERNL